ncbi:GUN4 domain-containing protein [Dapis sp. BLCC M229]|uniref:GUN4 domain-containing protein n=1 Tax=Dapis sp. BLCC M229 TaxID=3400188 RepID=UPI003CED2472
MSVLDIENFPCSELNKIHQLWVDYSQGRFAFSVQKSIYSISQIGEIHKFSILGNSE